MKLSGKTALVTGGGIRLGRAFSLALADKGVNLAIHYHGSREKAEETAAMAQSKGVRAITVQADFNAPDTVRSVFPTILQSFKVVDILINNAAIYLKGKGLETNQENWEKQFHINLQAPFLLTQAFAQQLPPSRPGRIVNITDAQLLQHYPGHFAYRLTKAALIEMTYMFALELAPQITVNALALGIMLPLAGKEGEVDLQEIGEARIPLKRAGSPQIAVENALHLIKSDFTTGAVLRVDGGEYLSH
jgi:glucose 1-dehydrogenase